MSKRLALDAPTQPEQPDSAAPLLSFRLAHIDSLIPYARNPRTHSPEQVAQLAASMIEFGFTAPILADVAGIVAGHGRVMAARKVYDANISIKLPNGTELPFGFVPVLDVDGWNATKRRAYVIADNQLPDNAGWNLDLLRIELLDLKSDGFDLSIVAFDEKALASMLGDVGANANAENQNIGGDRNLLLTECKDETELQSLFEELTARGLQCKLMN